jgi:hypothetical protein
MLKIFLILNTVVASASTLSGVLAFFKPQLFLDVNEVSESEKFYSRMYAIRAIPIGILFIVLPWVATGIIVSILLFLGALIQVLDAILGIMRRNVKMIIGPSFAAIIHIICGILLL